MSIDVSAIEQCINFVGIPLPNAEAKSQLSALKDGHQEMIEECRRLRDGMQKIIKREQNYYNNMIRNRVGGHKSQKEKLDWVKSLLDSPSAKVDEKSKECPKCNGTGLNPENRRCEYCHGSGKNPNRVDEKPEEGECPACWGDGVIETSDLGQESKCPKCNGTGIDNKQKEGM